MIRLMLCMLLVVPIVYSRNAKWYFPKKTVTNTVYQRRLMTSVVPSSCVVIDPSLPTCRKFRRLDIAPTRPTSIEATISPNLIGPRSFEIESGESSPSGRSGGSWFGSWSLADHTVTRTLLRTETVRQYNPDEMVSIVFKGCQPTSLPFNLSPCNSTSNATNQIQRDLHFTTE